ncbi:DUF1877 family protein [Streptomyces melanogenes]|uniref:DUF1877 family protein n=1 Tax=Streptomyces melanogenes TaxID=67326 RepID=UPI00167CDC5B|nr:DUF1877 family protein [Streptomyces melanogenes]
MAAFPVAPGDVQSGFQFVLTKFGSVEEADLERSEDEWEVCDLGEEWDIIRQVFLLAGGADDISDMAVEGDYVLGDDGAGTVCTILDYVDVLRVRDFLGSVSHESFLTHAVTVASRLFSGEIPEGYLSDLDARISSLCVVYDRAVVSRENMAFVFQG